MFLGLKPLRCNAKGVEVVKECGVEEIICIRRIYCA
jgi:hypothetical protein